MTVATGELTEALDRVEYEAEYDLWSALPASVREAAGVIADRIGGCRVMGSRLTPSAAMLNRVMGATAADVQDGSLAEAIALLHGAGCVCQVPVREETRGGLAVRSWLEGRGFADGYAWMKFAHDGSSGPPSPQRPPLVRVRLCEDADRDTFGEILVAAYAMPPALAAVGAAAVGRDRWRCYLAETGEGEAVAIGALFVDGDAGWLGLGATLTEARGMGAQGALLRVRVAEARRLGCQLVVTETGERVDHLPSISYRNILRAGFVEQGLRRQLVAAP